MSVKNDFSGLCVNGLHWFNRVSEMTLQRHYPFDSDAPNAVAYNSDSALLIAMIFCLRVYAFNM